MLSLAGRVTLVKSVLDNIPLYAMQSKMFPKCIYHDIEGFICRFIWGVSNENDDIHHVKWFSVRRPIENGINEWSYGDDVTDVASRQHLLDDSDIR
ncbi:hypothetical protein GQ457_01G019970 [Hibiscus cannabinus]